MQYMYQEPLNYDSGVGVVLGSFSPLHKGHLDLIYQAKKECLGGVLVVVCGYNDDKGWPKMTLKERYQMVREFFKDDPLVAVYALSDDEMRIAQFSDNQDEWKWDRWLNHLITDIIATNNDTIGFRKSDITFYTGELAYAKDLKELGYAAKLVNRQVNPISGTMIRGNIIKYWDDIAWTYHRKFSHNILITGTASEGKTTLVEDIGRYFNLPFSYEWARTYIEKHNIADWEFDTRDFVAFLQGQYEYNRSKIESKHNNGIFVADSDVLITKMYAYEYAIDPNMAMSEIDYYHVIEPLADMYIRKSNWNKIFVVTPKVLEIKDDHQRYMGHSSVDDRSRMYTNLMRFIEEAGWMDKVEFLRGDYNSNFERVKEYIKSIGGQENE